ncbi:hypothetical protein MLD38_001427 [Melastoma candidum]|uniref:Uncharacterized protein n=1 Tax=Melastoma candidum TaxID=119954 RepID=A0ACB9SD72_9MYRT|nr:hypothetical protein MLD38_001427 [Melastoma candidum]
MAAPSLSQLVFYVKKFAETSKRRFQRSKYFRNVEKAFPFSVQERNFNCRIPTLRIVLIIIVIGTFVTLYRSPAIYGIEHPSGSRSRHGLVQRWTKETARLNPPYASSVDINWNQVKTAIEKLTDRNEYQGVGLLNFGEDEAEKLKDLIPEAEHVLLHLQQPDSIITWESLYPEWIDEEEDFEVPTCPSLPQIQVPGKPRLDLIAVKLPCNKFGKWSRDVARLHLQLATARLATSAKSYHPVRVLFVTDCFPIPNLFSCRDLISRDGNIWLYEPDLNRLRKKSHLPVGSCELSVPLKAKENFHSERAHREAYATILHSAHSYVCGAITAAQRVCE